MESQQIRVLEFMQKFKREYKDKPIFPNIEQLQLSLSLIEEEFSELIEACGDKFREFKTWKYNRKTKWK